MEQGKIFWKRSKDGIIAGVCRGLAESLGLETWVVRLVFFLGILMGLPILIYFALALGLPREDRLDNAYDAQFLGVCGRLAKISETDIGLIRVLCLLSLLVSFGGAFLFYVGLYIFLPKQI